MDCVPSNCEPKQTLSFVSYSDTKWRKVPETDGDTEDGKWPGFPHCCAGRGKEDPAIHAGLCDSGTAGLSVVGKGLFLLEERRGCRTQAIPV